ncbi:MAG: hypothetical protein JWQ04_1288 [Pedosphaera sp.]|nr:hypothetical protein [Pedosphaera sp.]
MKRLLCCGILAASMVAAYVYRQGNQNLYSINIVGGGWSYGPSWRIGPSSCGMGFSERTELGFQSEWWKTHQAKTYTDFEIGSHHMTIQGDAYAWFLKAAYVGSTLAIASAFWIITTPRFRPKD